MNAATIHLCLHCGAIVGEKRHRCTEPIRVYVPGRRAAVVRTVRLTPAGWAASKYGRDPRGHPR